MQSDNVARATIKYARICHYVSCVLDEGKSDCIVRNISSSVSYCDERLYILRLAK